MKLTIVVGMLGQHEMTTVALHQILENITNPETEVLVFDNGGDYEMWPEDPRLTVYHSTKNLGVYPVFKKAFELDVVKGDVVAFFHSDVMIVEKGFDERVIEQFQKDPQLGLVGFVGSTEIDWNGGRGGGTVSNFQGLTYHTDGQGVMVDNKVVGNTLQHWTGSPAEAHGRRDAGFTNAAVVDGCVMIIRRSAWERIGYREDFVPHHFYDRLISTQMLEAGYKVGVLGIAFDHLGGQTVSREMRYFDVAREYCMAHKVDSLRDQGSGTPNWDATIYLKGETDWLREYRDQKHLVPIRV